MDVLVISANCLAPGRKINNAENPTGPFTWPLHGHRSANRNQREKQSGDHPSKKPHSKSMTFSIYICTCPSTRDITNITQKGKEANEPD